MTRYRLQGLLLSTVAAALLAAAPAMAADAPTFKPLELSIAHINDHHSQLEPISGFELTLDGQPTQVEIGGFAREVTLFKEAAATKKNLLKVHAGDATTGTLYYTFFKGAADAQLMNQICFDTFTPGNHEFDDGDEQLAKFIGELHKGSCQTDVISANVIPEAGTPLAPAGGTGLIKPYVIKKVDGVDVAIIGLTVAGKTRDSSRPLASTQLLDEATAAQKAIDEVKAKGVRHIVISMHYGYPFAQALAAKLTDVDVIISADTHVLLGDFSPLGIASSGPYPTIFKNKDGDNVCAAEAWEYSKIFGLLDVSFDDHGKLASCAGQPTLIMGDKFKRKGADGKWAAVSDEDKAALTAKLSAMPDVKIVKPDEESAKILATYTSQIEGEKAKKIGAASESLCLVRMPGETTNRSAAVAGCETANTLAHGSDIGQVVADAFLTASKRADFSLQNAGGVRVPVAAGDLTMNSAFTLLPFTNVLVELNVTGAEMLSALEDGVSNIIDNGKSDGSFPYAAGLRWTVDMSKAKGSRFSNVEVRSKTDGTWSPLDPAKTYVLVTNDFVASGKDGYVTLGPIYAAGKFVNTYLLYTQTFVDYVMAKGSIARPAAADYSNQKVIGKDGVALP